jgi:PAS domain S-box-containing protein
MPHAQGASVTRKQERKGTSSSAPRKKARLALRGSKERFRLTFDQSPIGTLIADPTDFHWVRANKAFCHFIGYSEKELSQLTYVHITHPDDLAHTAEQTRRLVAGEISIFEAEKRYIRKDGSVVWGHLLVQALKDGAGRVLYTLGMIQDITERKRVDEALRESEERYRTAIEHSNDGVVIIKEGRHVYVNQRFLDIFDYHGPEEIIGKTIAEARHVHPDDRGWLAEINRRRPAGEPTPSRYEHRAVGKNGKLLYVEASATRIMHHGEPASLSYLRDVTERRQAGLRLRDSEEALKSLLNATSDIACLIDTGGIIIAANGILAQRLGKDPDNLIGQNIFGLFPKEIAHSRRLWAQEVIESGKPVRGEDSFTDNRYFDTCVYPVFDAEGKVVRLAIFAKDITEAKRASLALAESEARFRQLFDSVNDGIALRDARTFELLDANRRLCDMWGYTLDELQSLPLGSLGAYESVEERRARLIAYYTQAAQDTPSLFQWPARKKDGSTFWVELNVTKITVGTRECLLSVVRDITERKHAEERVRASLEEKEVLLKEIHHRVKNNLQIVSSLLYLQAARTEHAGAVSALRESRNRVRSMALIHERLYQSPNLASVDMGEYTRNLVSDLRHTLRITENTVGLALSIEDIPLGVTEAIPCALIINELVSNALRHAFPEGRAGEITIRLTREENDTFTLVVSDNGVGFPEYVDFRNSPSLGLTLINSLVKQLEGTIELARGGGTTFTINFRS